MTLRYFQRQLDTQIYDHQTVIDWWLFQSNMGSSRSNPGLETLRPLSGDLGNFLSEGALALHQRPDGLMMWVRADVANDVRGASHSHRSVREFQVYGQSAHMPPDDTFSIAPLQRGALWWQGTVRATAHYTTSQHFTGVSLSVPTGTLAVRQMHSNDINVYSGPIVGQALRDALQRFIANDAGRRLMGVQPVGWYPRVGGVPMDDFFEGLNEHPEFQPRS